MKIRNLKIHNFRSILDVSIDIDQFMMFVGANNSGKSNVFAALRCFYDDLAWCEDDFPKIMTNDQRSWMEIEFCLAADECDKLADKYKSKDAKDVLVLRRVFKGEECKSKQSNIFAVVDGVQDKDLFYGAKNVGAAKCGSVIYIPALTTADAQFKTTGASPFKQLVSFFMKRAIKGSLGLLKVKEAFDALNLEAKKDGGFLDSLEKPINNSIRSWGITFDVHVNPIDVNDISKNLIQPSFIDERLGDATQGIERFGSGFQRVMIYELIRAASNLNEKPQEESPKATKKDFQPDFNLILFEEPEAFLHPSQQEVMSRDLRKLSLSLSNQVFITSHSPVFVGKGITQIKQICRLTKVKGETRIFKIAKDANPTYENVGVELINKIQLFVSDRTVVEADKKRARELLKDSPSSSNAIAFDRFRFQMWLDTMRSSMFFADKVLLVEGETERVLFNYLLATEWADMNDERIFVIDALGKFNFVRYLRFFKAFGIRHGIIYDEDSEPVHIRVINPFIESETNEFTLGKPVCLHSNLEVELGKPIPGRGDQKPLEILKMLHDGNLKPSYPMIKKWLCSALAIPIQGNVP